jgi:hypothetical protein
MSKKILSLFLLLFAAGSVAPLARAQNNQTYNQRWFFASDFGQWSIKGPNANTYQWYPGTICLVPSNGSAGSFNAFNTNAPILIVDATPANTEVVTPSAVTQNASVCQITISPANQHYSFQVTSGTGGLQENLNAINLQQPAPALIWLDRNWYALANQIPATTPAAIITAAKGGVSAILVDNTTAPFTNYVWQGTAYAAGTWVNTVPAAAAGAAAGSSPTISSAGAALAGTVSLTTGTATTTGTLFTLTYGLNTSTTTSQFNYAPTCTISSIGANPFTTFTFATTYPSSTHALVTVTETAVPTASTAYKFQFACH